MIPDNVEKIIMTKEDYDRNVEQLLYDKINAEQEVERLRNINEEHRILNGELRKELQQKENIIKEVREYIEPFYENAFDYTEFKEILEILTKGSDKE